MIVHAGAERAEAVAVRRVGDGDELAAGEIDIEIFDLGAPVRREPNLGAEARGPARRGMRLRKPEGLAGQFPESEAAGAVEQHVADGIAGAAAQRAEPRV